MIDPGMIRKLERELRERVEKLREDLKTQTVSGSSGGGAVTAVANGNQELVSITISKDAVDPDDLEMLQDLVLAAANQALEKAKKLNEDGMAGITGGLRFPGLF